MYLPLLALRRYLEAVTGCSRSAQLGRLLAVGAGAAIGDGCIVSQSVLGRGVSIGKNCRITGCYLQVGVAKRVEQTGRAGRQACRCACRLMQ